MEYFKSQRTFQTVLEANIPFKQHYAAIKLHMDHITLSITVKDCSCPPSACLEPQCMYKGGKQHAVKSAVLIHPVKSLFLH